MGVYQALPVQRGGGFGQKTLDGSRKYVIAAFSAERTVANPVLIQPLVALRSGHPRVPLLHCQNLRRAAGQLVQPGGPKRREGHGCIQAVLLRTVGPSGRVACRRFFSWLSVLGSNNGWTPSPR